MPPSPWSPTGVFTIVSLVTLCLLSFVVVLGSDNVVNTQVRDTVYAFPKRDTPHHRRSFHDVRAPLPQASNPPPSGGAPPSTPAAAPTPVQPTNQGATSQNPSPAPAPAPAPSPAPAPQSQPQPQSQAQPPAQNSPPPSAPSPAAPPPSNTPAASPPAASPTAGPSSALGVSASAQNNSSSSSHSSKVISNIGNYSATGYSYSYQPGTITALGGGTTSSLLPNSFAPATNRASPTATSTPKGFFANKAGVGVTFGIIGIILSIALVLVIRMIVKRYRDSRDAKEVDAWFEKYSSGHGSSTWHGDGQYATNNDDGQFGSGNRRSAYGVSASDVAGSAAMTSASPDAYPDRSVHFGGRPSSTASLGVVLPPSLNFAGIGGAVGAPNSPKPSHHSSLRNSLTPSQMGIPYAPPANNAHAAAAPRGAHVPYPPAAHGQEQVNFAANGDPYYSTHAAGVGASSMGYAQ